MVFHSESSSAKPNAVQNNNNGNTTNTNNNGTKMNNCSKRLNNELQKMNNKSQTRAKPKAAALKEKKCNEMVAKSVQKDERRKKHKHIRRGKKKILNNYPILSFDNFLM